MGVNGYARIYYRAGWGTNGYPFKTNAYPFKTNAYPFKTAQRPASSGRNRSPPVPS